MPEVEFTPSHLGLCVTDLARTMRFYCEGLGFTAAERYELTDTMLPGLDRALEVASPVSLVSQMITLGALKIELLAYASPGVHGAPSASRSQLGYTHLSFHVDDVDAAAAHLVASGGELLPETRGSLGIPIVFLADPDGARVELMGKPG